ncbi:hypothetical protein BFJ68_g12582 [Fusarium oxysporum]|uniref:NACHT domain-containing protein n=1 Tax=Fusarium oxysporum TaxID=5507 RepID=A0A420Q7G6_FUSOX|nr:hypothetical protein BFJ68_g12582 [Fusarium oxysporum]
MSNSSCLWAKARENLPADVRDWLASLEQGIQLNATGTEQIDALIKQTAQKQQELGRTSHKFKKYFDNIIRWLDKFKGIGDVVSSFDPVHAALPWAAFRFILQAILAEREQADTVLELLASTPHFVFSGRVLEMVYTQESMHIGGTQNEVKLSQQGLDNLREELIKLYSALLSALKYCYFISSQHKVKRKATAIFNSSELVSIHEDLEAQHKKVIDRGEDCRKILSHTLSRKSLDLLRSIQPSLTEIGDRVRELLVRIDESERRETLKSISSILYRAHHEEVSGKRTVGTCEWILKKEKFIRWEESDSSVTILYGNPGAGKTFLISRVVDYSIEKAEMSEAVAFFYCKREEENRRNPQDILRSILRQLSTPVKEVEGKRIHVSLKDLPNRLALNGTTFDVSTCESLIGRLIEDYSKTTIILDALDECNRNTREELMRVLKNLTNGSSKLRVFISSRHDEDILRHFEGTPIMEIQATDNEEDISSFVEDRLFRDSRWADLHLELQDDVEAGFRKKSLGMFLWVALQVDQIRRLRIWNETNIREQLKILPTGLKGAYDVVWNQMQEMSSYEEQLARRALQWVLCAFKPLKTAELSLMMQIDIESGNTDPNVVFTPETIQSICGNLLVYDRQSKVWRFSHLSAREYIEKHHYSMLEAHHHVAICSIKLLERYLLWDPPYKILRIEPLVWVAAPNRSDPDGPCVKFTGRCRYIVEYVLWHAHELDSPKCRHVELSNLLHNFFEPISQGSSYFQAWRGLAVSMDSMADRLVRKILGYSSLQTSSTPLQVMSIHGLFHIVRDLWERAGGELNVFPRLSPSPLTLAIMYGHEPIWKFILLAKAKVNKGTPAPLATAIQVDDIEAFEALLKAKVDVNYVYRLPRTQGFSTDPNTTRPDTPLKAALWHSRKPSRRYFLQRLLDRGADVNLKTRLGTTLELAVQYADEEAVRILLDANTEVYSPDHLLRLAARNRNFNLVPLFLKLGANIEEPFKGVLPLVWALREGNLPSVRSLLEMSGTYIDLSYQDHREAILSALSSRHRPNIFPALLFESNPLINWRDCETDTLSRAVSSYPKYEYEIRGLGFDGSNFALQCIEGTAHRQLSLFDTLFNAGADPYVSVNFDSGSTLTAAAFHGRLHHFRALLDQEKLHVKQEQRTLFRTVLFVLVSGRLGIESWKSHDNRRKPYGNEYLCPKHLEVLQLLFDGDLNVYIPIYDFLDPLIPLVYINGEGYEINNPCHLYRKGYYGYFSRLWFSIMWNLQNGTFPQLPLRSQLLRWQFPGTLPHQLSIVTRLTGLSRARPTYFIKLSMRRNRSQFIIVPVQQEFRKPLSQKSGDRRWKKYKPESFGFRGFTQVPDKGVGTGLSNTEVYVASGKVEAYCDSRYTRNIGWALIASLVGLLSFFIALLLPTRDYS